MCPRSHMWIIFSCLTVLLDTHLLIWEYSSLTFIVHIFSVYIISATYKFFWKVSCCIYVDPQWNTVFTFFAVEILFHTNVKLALWLHLPNTNYIRYKHIGSPTHYQGYSQWLISQCSQAESFTSLLLELIAVTTVSKRVRLLAIASGQPICDLSRQRTNFSGDVLCILPFSALI